MDKADLKNYKLLHEKLKNNINIYDFLDSLKGLTNKDKGDAFEYFLKKLN